MLLDYTTYTNVVGCNDFFDKLRLWAVSQGWTQEEWRTGEIWDASSHWISDSRGRFLTLSKSGYGTQNLIASFATASRVDYPSFGLLGGMRSQVAYDLDTSTHPVGQYLLCGPVSSMFTSHYYNKDGANCGMDLTYDSIIPKVWFFAGTHWIAGVAQMDSNFCTWMHFGSFELLDDNPSTGQCMGMYGYEYNYTGQSYKYPWHFDLYRYGVGPSPIGPSYHSLYAGSRFAGFDMYYDGRCWYNWNYGGPYGESNIQISGTSPAAELCGVSTACYPNHFSAKRPLIRPVYSYLRSADSIYVPIAKAPIWVTAFAGLTIGEQLDQDSMSYLVFPHGTIYNRHGYAFRIA